MKRFSYSKLSEEDEAVLSSDSPVKDDEYNKGYREWRLSENNPFVFSGNRFRKLHTYVDGIGLCESTSEKREKTALKNMCVLITIIAVMYALAENVFILPVIMLMKLFGIEISYSFHENMAYGNQYAVLLVFIIEGILKLLLPVLIARKALKMPAKTAYPVRMGSKWAFFAAVSSVLIGFAIMSFLRVYLPTNIFTANNTALIYKLSLNMDVGCAVIFLIFELIVLPVLMELLFHGALFQALRQFGVSFAVLVTAVLSAAVMHNPFSAGTVLITSIIAGYGIWQSGSVFTGIIVHIIGRAMSFALYSSKDLPDINGIPAEIIFMLLVFAAGLLGWLLLSGFGSKVLSMKDYGTFLSMRTKLKILFTGPVVAVLILYAILVCIEIFV